MRAGNTQEKQSERKDEWKLEELEILSLLGEGNSSVVHKAKHKPSGKLVALKQISNIGDRGKRHQLIKELNTLYRADCPCLISFYGAFFKDGAISIALELMDAGSLADLLTSVKSIPEPELAWFTKQILEGLAYLRARHQVHRDIKPSNICVNTNGEAKLTDFGITRELEATLEHCQSFVGTSAYMSPERIQGEKYSYPSDIWSLGISLLECATGKFPYPNTSVVIELISSIVNGASPEAPETFSTEFRNFIACCLQKDPAQRKSASDLIKHPWLGKAGKLSKEHMAAWVQKALKKSGQSPKNAQTSATKAVDSKDSTVAAARDGKTQAQTPAQAHTQTPNSGQANSTAASSQKLTQNAATSRNTTQQAPSGNQSKR
jgi:mitogen-activated protein kinase kinase 1